MLGMAGLWLAWRRGVRTFRFNILFAGMLVISGIGCTAAGKAIGDGLKQKMDACVMENACSLATCHYAAVSQAAAAVCRSSDLLVRAACEAMREAVEHSKRLKEDACSLSAACPDCSYFQRKVNEMQVQVDLLKAQLSEVEESPWWCFWGESAADQNARIRGWIDDAEKALDAAKAMLDLCKMMRTQRGCPATGSAKGLFEGSGVCAVPRTTPQKVWDWLLPSANAADRRGTLQPAGVVEGPAATSGVSSSSSVGTAFINLLAQRGLAEIQALRAQAQADEAAACGQGGGVGFCSCPARNQGGGTSGGAPGGGFGGGSGF